MKVLIISQSTAKTALVKEELRNNPQVTEISVVDSYQKAKGRLEQRIALVDCIGNQLGVTELKPLCQQMSIKYIMPEFEKVVA
ncbi:MAG: hypothetical protein ACD_5C00143G0002 [uncultured bacterium]|nr:MAG: hypothetical protein ACD_5C00143G0002 [uncultured bacterium]